LDRSLGGPQSRSEHGDKEKNSTPLPGPEPPIIRPVTNIPLLPDSSHVQYKEQIVMLNYKITGELDVTFSSAFDRGPSNLSSVILIIYF
jgi:hypothetical protein